MVVRGDELCNRDAAVVSRHASAGQCCGICLRGAVCTALPPLPAILGHFNSFMPCCTPLYLLCMHHFMVLSLLYPLPQFFRSRVLCCRRVQQHSKPQPPAEATATDAPQPQAAGQAPTAAHVPQGPAGAAAAAVAVPTHGADGSDELELELEFSGGEGGQADAAAAEQLPEDQGDRCGEGVGRGMWIPAVVRAGWNRNGGDEGNVSFDGGPRVTADALLLARSAGIGRIGSTRRRRTTRSGKRSGSARTRRSTATTRSATTTSTIERWGSGQAAAA